MHTIQDPPVYDQNLATIAETDLVHADVVNPLFSQLINNDAYLKAETDALALEIVVAEQRANNYTDQQVTSALQGTGLGADMPPGSIIMYHGAEIPLGWAICDGQNGTPDLRDRFIVGAGGTYQAGDIGGSNSVTLSTAQLPSHNHSGSVTSSGSHSHGDGTLSTEETGSHRHAYTIPESVAFLELASGNNVSLNFWIGERLGETQSITPHEHNITGNTSSSGSHAHSISIGNTGLGDAHENRPPYYALVFIMKLEVA